MRFDPEKVRRTVGECNFGEGWYDYDVVQAEDYDQLLALLHDQLKASLLREKELLDKIARLEGSVK